MQNIGYSVSQCIIQPSRQLTFLTQIPPSSLHITQKMSKWSYCIINQNSMHTHSHTHNVPFQPRRSIGGCAFCLLSQFLWVLSFCCCLQFSIGGNSDSKVSMASIKLDSLYQKWHPSHHIKAPILASTLFNYGSFKTSFHTLQIEWELIVKVVAVDRIIIFIIIYLLRWQ